MKNKISSWLNRPFDILILCLVALVLCLITDRTWTKLLAQRSELKTMESQITDNQKQIQNLNRNIASVSDPLYIERQAKDLLGLVKNDELIFVFSEE